MVLKHLGLNRDLATKNPKQNQGTVKPVLSSHLRIDKTKVLKTYGSLMKVESNLQNAPLGAFCNTFDLH